MAKKKKKTDELPVWYNTNIPINTSPSKKTNATVATKTNATDIAPIGNLTSKLLGVNPMSEKELVASGSLEFYEPKEEKKKVYRARSRTNRYTPARNATSLAESGQSVSGTILNGLKLFGQEMMKAEEAMFIDTPAALVSNAILGGSKVVGKGVSIFDKEAGGKIYSKGVKKSKELNNFIKEDLTGNAMESYGWNNKLSNGKTVAEQLEGDSAIKSTNLAGKVIEGLGGMAPTILIGGLINPALGGGAASSVQDIEKIKKIQNIVPYSSLGARSFGGGYEEALKNGATTGEATAYGLSSAAVEIGTEWLSGGIPGVKGTAGGGIDNLFGKYVLKEGVEETSKSLSKAIVKSLYKTGMEGLEESISETLEPFIKQFTYQYDENKSFGENFKEAASQLRFQDIVEAGIVGSLTAIALGDVDIKDMQTGYQNGKIINSTVNEMISAQENMLGRKLTVEEKSQVKSDVNELFDNVTKPQVEEQVENEKQEETNPYRERAIAQKEANQYQENLQQDKNYWDSLEKENNIEKPKGYVEEYKEGKYENQNYKAMTEEDANLYQEALMHDEDYLKSVDEQAAATENNTKIINRITKGVQERLGIGNNQRAVLEATIRNAVENNLTADEIETELLKNFSTIVDKTTNTQAKEVKQTIKNTPLKVSDGIKKDIADYGDVQRKNFNKVSFSKNGIPVDVAYAELSNMYPDYFPSDVINPSDQLQKIIEVANVMTDITETYSITPDEMDNIVDYITDSINQDKYNSQMEADVDLQKEIQFNFPDDVLPTTIRSQESIDNTIENRDIAPVREEQPFKQTLKGEEKKNNLKEKAQKTWGKFQETVVNRNYEIDKLAKATGNDDIKYHGDMLNSYSGEVNFNVNNWQTDSKGRRVGKSIKEIFAPSKKAGLYNAFNDYLVQKSNIERHAVGKGSQIPLAVSQQLVTKYEAKYPEFKTWAKDVYTYFDNVLQDQVDSGLISQEKYNDYRGENGIYRSYVPFYEANYDSSRYYDANGEVKAVSTLKRTKGGAKDTGGLLAVEDAMVRQTYATKKAIRQNNLLNEIVLTQEKYDNMMDDDLRSDPTNLDDSLFTTEDGEKIVSAYVDGKKISAKVSDELFNELTKDNENRVKQFEEDFSIITNPLQKISNVRRNLLTTWNPSFLARNAIKDIQDAVINSKHTTGMLKNYIPGIKELIDAKTAEAQQFLALYGTDNLYGDYSKEYKSKNPMKYFTKLNEIIELAPRFAEFKASLQAGESVEQAMYNAREVTTNFGRGGYITKALNRNGATFLNANVQGLSKAVRNLTGQNGVKGVVGMVIKGAMFSILPSILNNMLYGSDDEKDKEYEALPNYIKDNYYLIKLEGGNFLRIPKGRISAVMGSAARRFEELADGNSEAFKGWANNAWDQIGVGDIGSNNILAPIKQAFGSENGEAWYGGDIVPTRLQNKPAAEQSDEKTDAISKFVGENLGISPKKLNYVLDQYSGAIGDMFLPMITPASSNGAERVDEYLLAPVKDSFVVNSTDDNRYAGEFYEKSEELQKKSNSDYATDTDKLKYKYISNISSELSKLYKEKREIQLDETLSNKEKYSKVQVVQNEINSLARDALKTYENVNQVDGYANVGDIEYYKNTKDEWTKVNESDSEFTSGLSDKEKSYYYKTKNSITNINSEYKEKTKNLKDESVIKKHYTAVKKKEITEAIKNSGLDNYTKAIMYGNNYSSKEKMTNIYNAGYDIDKYITAQYKIEEIRDKYSQKKGYSTEYRKKKTIAYINSLNMNIPQKAMLIRQYYSSYRNYNVQIAQYVASLNISYEDRMAILKDTGMNIKGNTVTWN